MGVDPGSPVGSIVGEVEGDFVRSVTLEYMVANARVSSNVSVESGPVNTTVELVNPVSSSISVTSSTT